MPATRPATLSWRSTTRCAALLIVAPDRLAEMAPAFDACDSVRRPSVSVLSSGTMGSRSSGRNYGQLEAIASDRRPGLGPVCRVPARHRLVCGARTLLLRNGRKPPILRPSLRRTRAAPRRRHGDPIAARRFASSPSSPVFASRYLPFPSHHRPLAVGIRRSDRRETPCTATTRPERGGSHDPGVVRGPRPAPQ